MTAKNQTLEMYEGDTMNVVIPVVKNGNPEDITGSTVKWGVKSSVSDKNPLIMKTTADGITLSDPINGEFTIRIEPEDTEGLSGHYYHEAELTDASGNVSTITVGTIIIYESGI